MLVPYPGTKEFNHYFSSIPLKEIEWQNFVAIGEHCVLKNAAISINKIQTMIAKANLHYYLHPIRIINLLRHIRTPYELSNYVRGGLSLLRQILRWSERPLS